MALSRREDYAFCFGGLHFNALELFQNLDEINGM
jgi:hypothetical protein